MKRKFSFAVLLCAIVLPTFFLTKIVDAALLSYPKVENNYVNVYTKQGNDWFKAVKEKTDKQGDLTLNKMLPGKYRIEKDDNSDNGSVVDVKANLYDEKGIKFNDKVEVNVYAFITFTGLVGGAPKPGNTKILAGTLETNKDGEIELNNVWIGLEYEIEVNDNASLSKKTNRPRIKVKAKIEESDWFDTAYKRTDDTNTVYLKDVIPGKYKFKYKSGDVVNPMQKFNLHIRLRDDKGKKIKKSKEVTIYAYMNDQKILVGKFMTTKKGELYLPNTAPIEYKIEVK